MAVSSRLRVDYDAEGDILEVSFARPQRDVAIEVEDDVFVHVNPKTKKVVAVTLLNFSRRFAKGGHSVSLPLEVDSRPVSRLLERIPAAP